MTEVIFTIKNYYYQINGYKHWFLTRDEGVKDFANRYPDIYNNCMDSENYVKLSWKDIKSFKVNEDK